MPPGSPHVGRVVDLVDPYMTMQTNMTGGKCVGASSIELWLNTHPGRWALVAEERVGVSPEIMHRLGFATSAKRKALPGYRLYAQLPHPEAEDLATALARTAPGKMELPAITKSDFNWSPAELADAVYVMRENLFPVSGRTP